MKGKLPPVRKLRSIGEVSRLTGVHIETIRYYERIGVMPDPPRGEGGQRRYNEELLRRLTFVRKSRDLGFTLEAIRGLLALVEGHDYTCGEVQQIAQDHLEQVRTKLKELQSLEGALSNMVSECAGGDIPECPVIDALWKVDR